MNTQMVGSRSRMSIALGTFVIAATLMALSGAAAQQHTDYKRDLPSRLMKQTSVTEPAAARTALAKVHNGRIQAVELENENGRLIYSYEIKAPGRSGVQEVNVNAKTGAVVNVEHESAAAEAREAAGETGKAGKTPERRKAARDSGTLRTLPPA